MPSTTVAVIGGGISGLAAAYQLHQQDTSFVLIEKSDRLGGLILTEKTDDFTIDAGPDSLLVQKPAAIELCVELGLQNQLVSTLTPRTAYIVRDGILHPIPQGSVFGIPTNLESLLASGYLSKQAKIRMAEDLVIPPKLDESDESVGSFFRRRFGNEAVAYLATPLLAGIHAGNVEHLSMRALFPRLVKAETEHGSVIRGFRNRRSDATSSAASHGVFRSLTGGLHTLTNALAQALPRSSIKYGTDVTNISDSGPFTVSFSSGENLSVDKVICATPSYVTASVVQSLNPELSRLLSSIPYTSIATIATSYPRAAINHALNGTGFVVPETESPLSITACTWISSKWPGRSPDGHVLLRSFVGGARAPEALDQSDHALTKSVQNDLRRLLDIDVSPSLTRVYRWPRANPQLHVGHLELVAQIDRHLRAYPGLQLIGSALRGVGIPDCVAAGRAAGRAATTST
jgi:oxygen-dependent protoporphyrinogen oxidase|tara:strand:+ start:1986 stop:3365 length:1380 start_codon:yes stop_codon:yes gene_type:complete